MLKDVRESTRCYLIGDEKDYLYYRKGSGDTIEIYDIAVKSGRRGGVGTRMFNELIEKEDPERVFAITRRSNRIAQKFYQSLKMGGMKLPAFYPDEDAIMYVWRKQ